MSLLNALIEIELKLKQYKVQFIFLILFWLAGLSVFVAIEPNHSFWEYILFSLTIRRPENAGDFTNFYSLLWPILLEVIVFGFIMGELLEKYKNQQTEVEDSNYINIIKNELERVLKDDWVIYSTKRKCIIFKSSWLEDFKEFYSKHFPFLHYTVNSWMDNDGFEINVGFNLRESSDKGAKVGLREKFTIILDSILQQEDTDFHYLISIVVKCL